MLQSTLPWWSLQNSQKSEINRKILKLPRVVPNQQEKFLSDDLFQRNASDMQVRYTQFRDLPLGERRAKFLAGCRQGHIEVSHMNTGLVLVLKWNPVANDASCQFSTKDNKVWLSCPLILNGVCVQWRGHVDALSLEGSAAIHFDPIAAKIEDERLRRQLHLNLASLANNNNEAEERREQQLNDVHRRH